MSFSVRSKFLILTDDFLAVTHTHAHIEISSVSRTVDDIDVGIPNSNHIYSHLQCVQTAHLRFAAVSYQLLDSRLDGFSTFISGFVYLVISYSFRCACEASALTRQYTSVVAIVQLFPIAVSARLKLDVWHACIACVFLSSAAQQPITWITCLSDFTSGAIHTMKSNECNDSIRCVAQGPSNG